MRSLHVSKPLRRRLPFRSITSLVRSLHAYVSLVRCVVKVISGLEANLLLGWMMHIGWMLGGRRMMGSSPPQPECQVVDGEAAYYDRDANNLHKLLITSRLENGSWKV